MEIKEFMAEVLKQMNELKTDANKKNYLVDNLEFELSFTVENNANAGVKLSIINIGGNTSHQNSHKVKIKLEPKGNRNMK